MSEEMVKQSEYDTDEYYVVPSTATKGFAGRHRVPGLEAAVDPRDSQVLKATADVLGGMTPQRLAQLAGVEHVDGEMWTDPAPSGATQQVSGHVWEISFEKSDEPSKTMLLITPSQDVSDVCEAFKQKNLRAIVQSIQHLGRITGRAEIMGDELKKPAARMSVGSAIMEIRNLGIKPSVIYKELSQDLYDDVKRRHFQIPGPVFEAAFDRNVFGIIVSLNAASTARARLADRTADAALELEVQQTQRNDGKFTVLGCTLADAIEDRDHTTITRIVDSVYQSTNRAATAGLAYECHAQEFGIPENEFIVALNVLVAARESKMAEAMVGAPILNEVA